MKKKLKEKKVTSIISTLVFIAVLLGLYAIVQGPSIPEDCSSLIGKDQEICIYDYAINAQEKSFCALLHDKRIAQSCIAEIALALNESDLCASLEKKTQGYCLKQFAEKELDVARCDKIIDNEWKDECFFDLAFLLNTSEHCLAMTNEKGRDTCLSDSGKETLDATACESITDILTRERCYTAIAPEVGDVNICLNIYEYARQATCVQRVAVQLNDSSTCDFIAADALKNSCYNRLEELA